MFFAGLNENLTTFLYTEQGGQEIIFLKGEKSFLVLLYKVYNKVEMSATKKFGFQFQFLVSVYPTDRSIISDRKMFLDF